MTSDKSSPEYLEEILLEFLHKVLDEGSSIEERSKNANAMKKLIDISLYYKAIRTGMKINAVARELNISTKSLYNQLDALGLEAEDIRTAKSLIEILQHSITYRLIVQSAMQSDTTQAV